MVWEVDQKGPVGAMNDVPEQSSVPGCWGRNGGVALLQEKPGAGLLWSSTSIVNEEGSNSIFLRSAYEWSVLKWVILGLIMGLIGLAKFYSITLTVILSALANKKDLLVPFVFQPLPLGSIKPEGWLKDQMQLMADGLAGHNHDFYPYVKQSSWVGGDQEYSQLNEGFPYWFNGIVPLAYGLDNDRLKDQIQDSIEKVLDLQADDGWIGPEKGQARNFWARYPLFLGMIQLVEADPSYSHTILPALHRFVELQNDMLKDDYAGYLILPGDVLSDEDHNWGRARVPDMMITLQWLLEYDPADQTQMLLDNLDYLRRGQIDWAEWYREGTYIKEDLSLLPESVVAPLFPYEHGVNVGQGLKAGAVINRFTRNATLLDMARRAVDWTFQYHGAASGTILADERLKGLGPYYGSEFCTTVEAMYSLSYLYQAIGDNSFADRAELAAFNALPAQVTPNWWAHQYITQPNQPFAKKLPGAQSDRVFWNVNEDGITYGLQPNYPCCTVNHPQGYPKFLSAMFARVGDNGLAHVLLSPGSVSTKLSSGPVTVTCDTNYPFSNSLRYTIKATAPFKFSVRVPDWALSTTSSFALNQASAQALSPDSRTGMHTLNLHAGISTLTMTLDHSLTIQQRANDSISVFSGPLLYALEIGSRTNSTSNINAPHQAKNYEIFNTTPWNIAIDPKTLVLKSLHPKGFEGELDDPIWAPGAPPTWIEGWGCEIDWPLWKQTPGPVPPLDDRECIKHARRIRLVPYGSAKIHMSELPTIDLGS